jgi:hypothetical protein
MDFAQLKIGERYLFHQNKDGIIEYFRANYLGTHVWKKYTTLVVKNFENENCKINKNTIYYIMNTNNILHAETLDTIVQPTICKLPDDILREINVFY